MSKTATTSRYHESIGCGILPFVHIDYDINNTLVADDWQRISTVEELYEKLKDSQFEKKKKEIEKHYINNTMKTEDEYYKIFKDRFDYVLIDEYQDTEQQVLEIFLDYFSEDEESPTICLFGDSMQSIYEKGVGDLSNYIESGKLKEVLKDDNWRCSKNVITLINKVRNDDLTQKPAGKNVQGTITFLYSSKNLSIDFVSIIDARD